MRKNQLPILISLFLGTLLFNACGGEGSSTKERKGLDMEVHKEMKAKELLQEYQKADEEAEFGDNSPLDDKYEGKKLMVTGKIKGKGSYMIADSDTSGKNIRLKVDSQGDIDRVVVNLKNDERQDDLEEGMKVKAAGTYIGQFRGPAIHDSKVMVLEE